MTYTATLAGDLPLGTLVSQTSWLAYPEHGILFDRVTDLYVNFPDLDHSTMTVTPAHGLQAKDLLTYTIVLKNDGLVNNPVVTLTNTLPHLLELVSLDTPSQGALVSSGKTLTWTTALAKNEVATLTYRAVISYEAGSDIKNIAYVQDGLSPTLALTARAAFKRTRFYLPVIWKN